MNFLEELHKKIDASDWDAKQDDLIDKAFLEAIKNWEVAGEKESLRKSEVERQTFAFNKFPKIGLTYKIAGTRKLEDGSEVPFEWPDIKDWTEDDFIYIRTRFDNCKNLYAKSEYGLLLFYAGKLKNNNDVQILLTCLINLADNYYKKVLSNDDKEYYIISFQSVLANAFFIANNRKNDGNIEKLFEQLIRFTTDVHNNWDVTRSGSLRTIIDLTDFVIEYKDSFLKYNIPLKKYLDQNYKAVQEIAKTYNWGAIYICDTSKKLADIINDKRYNWLEFKAQQFEAMIQQSIEEENLAAVKFVESALEIYKQLKNKVKVNDLSKKYDQVRRMFRLGEIRQDLPEKESRRIAESIKKLVAEKNSRELIEILYLTPMYPSLEQINKMAEELYKESTFARLLPTSIIDKYGNTVDVFIEEDEKKKFGFWQTYGFNFQLGTQHLVHFFSEAYKEGKINCEEIIAFLSGSWLAETYSKLYSGISFDICPLDVIKPGIKSFFNELEQLRQEKSPNFICTTDSLVTKIEYLIRFICSEFLDIATFKDKRKLNLSSDNIISIKQEKNIDDLLSDLEDRESNPTGFSEEHRKFIQFILTNKAGRNLRHRIAHGLMDANEYSIDNVLLLLSIILKLSSYK